MASFRDLLLENVTPRIKVFYYRHNESLNYVGNPFYDNKLKNGSISDKEAIYFGFYKKLFDSKYGFIVFQREQTNQMLALGNRFTVYLMRHKPVSIKAWFTVKNPTERDIVKTNIGSILRYAYQLKNISSENWWNPEGEEEVVASLNEAAYYLEEYGIPWLEDRASKSIDLSFSDERAFFNQFVGSVLQDRMTEKVIP